MQVHRSSHSPNISCSTWHWKYMRGRKTRFEKHGIRSQSMERFSKFYSSHMKDGSYPKFDNTKIYMMMSIVSCKTERKFSTLSVRNTFWLVVLEERLNYLICLSIEMILQNWCHRLRQSKYAAKNTRKYELQRWVRQLSYKDTIFLDFMLFVLFRKFWKFVKHCDFFYLFKW